MDVSIWMLVGFLLAAYSVVANDSLQTLGTYLSSNRKRTPKPVQMLFICTVTCGVLLLGWFLNNGDPTWGRLSLPGNHVLLLILIVLFEGHQNLFERHCDLSHGLSHLLSTWLHIPRALRPLRRCPGVRRHLDVQVLYD